MAIEEYDDDDGDEDNLGPACHVCGGSGRFVSCIDDMCHGQESCIHGDGDDCYLCGGTGNARPPFSPAEGASTPPLPREQEQQAGKGVK